MLVQVCDSIINTEQINYVSEFTDALGNSNTHIVFINRDAIDLPISLKDFCRTINYRALACRVRDVELKDVEPRQDVTKK